MKRAIVIGVLGLGTILFTECGKDTTTNTGGIHDTLTIYNYDTVRIYYGDTTGGMVWNVEPGIPDQSARISSITWGGSAFVAVGYVQIYDSTVHYYGKVFTSPDGIAWTERTPGTIPILRQVTWAQNTFVAVGDSGTITTSSDGTTWTGQTSGTNNQLGGVVYGANKFLAYSYNDDYIILTSPDGTSWTIGTANITL